MLNKMLQARNKKGFTLMEMLIVVAIIAILVAVSIPVFTTQLEKARESTDAANIRSAYAEAMVKYLEANTPAEVVIVSQPMVQTTAEWTYFNGNIGGVPMSGVPNVSAGDTVTVTISAAGVASFAKS